MGAEKESWGLQLQEGGVWWTARSGGEDMGLGEEGVQRSVRVQINY